LAGGCNLISESVTTNKRLRKKKFPVEDLFTQAVYLGSDLKGEEELLSVKDTFSIFGDRGDEWEGGLTLSRKSSSKGRQKESGSLI